MSLIVCPECKSEVSNQAKACQKCGFPRPGGRATWDRLVVDRLHRAISSSPLAYKYKQFERKHYYIGKLVQGLPFGLVIGAAPVAINFPHALLSEKIIVVIVMWALGFALGLVLRIIGELPEKKENEVRGMNDCS